MEIEGTVTRAAVRALASDWADDPATVVEIVHDGYNADAVSGGYAFLCDRGMVVHGFGGAVSWSIDPGDDTSRRAKIERRWRETQHRNRPLGLADVNEWHRAAIAALVGGYESVADLPSELRAGVTDFALADGVFLLLRGHAQEPTEEAVLRAIALYDYLLELPKENRRAHPCPVCGRPAVGHAWEYTYVCDSCRPAATCSHGRRVWGHNTALSGGFMGRHVDDGIVCDQVTCDGVVTVGHQECHMGEAKFGGVFVGVPPLLPPFPAPPDESTDSERR